MKMIAHKITGDANDTEDCPGGAEDGYGMLLPKTTPPRYHCNYCGFTTTRAVAEPTLADTVREHLDAVAGPNEWSPLTTATHKSDLADEVFPLFLAYEDLFAHMADTNPADEVYTSRGHIVVRTTDNGDTRSVAFMDLGSILHLWSGQGATLTPQIARQLGKELVAWADRKNPPPFDLMVTLTGNALHYLSEAADDRAAMLHTLRLAVDRGTFKVKENEDAWSPPLTDGVLIQEGHEIP